MPLPGRRHTFAFESSKDMLTKLAWEIDALGKHLRFGKLEIATYIATNAAITAWHTTDWTWADMDAQQRASVGAKLGRQFNKLRDLEAYVGAIPEMHACRAIALAAKHSVLEPHSVTRFERVEAEVSVGPTTTAFGIELTNSPWNLIVKVDGQTIDALTMLRRASAFWEGFIRSNGIADQY